jgi:hypothetical protein
VNSSAKRSARGAWSLIVLIAASLAWAITVWLPSPLQSQNGPAGPPQLYENVPFDAHLLALDRRALDEAYHNQLLLLFSIWIKQQAKDPTQITTGLQLARRAYNQAAGQIARREQALHEEEERRHEK